MSVTQGVLFISFRPSSSGTSGSGWAAFIWALTVTEGAAFLVGLVVWLLSRRAIDRGLAEGSPERAEEALELAA
jgi:multidrug efflux pump